MPRGARLLPLLVFFMLQLTACTDDGGTHDPYARDCRLKAAYDPGDATPEKVFIAGDFNDWQVSQYAMRLADHGAYRIELDLDPGEYLYSIYVDGKSAFDSSNPLTAFDDSDVERSYVYVEDCSAPALRVDSSGIENGEFSAGLSFLKGSSGATLDSTTVKAFVDNGGALDVSVKADPGLIEISGAIPAGKHFISVSASDDEGRAAETLRFPVWNEDEEFTWEDAQIYQIVVDRFRRGGGALADDVPISYRYGGDLDGIVEAIEEGYFEKLGVNALWISPMYDNPDDYWTGFDGRLYESYHGYWPVAARAVEEKFGGEAALDNLVAVAHQHGLRVIVDIVMNHVHLLHPYWRNHKDENWFNHPDGSCVCGAPHCSWADAIDHCWFTEYLPDLQWKNRAVMHQIVDDTFWWLERFNLDGLRLDAIPMMPRLAARHLRRQIRKRLDKGPTHTYLLGETYTGVGGYGQIRWYLGPQGLSGQFDFPLMWTLREVIARGKGSFEDIENIIAEGQAAWNGSGAVMAPIIGNHDVERFITVASGDSTSDLWKNPPPQPENPDAYKRQLLALTLMLTQPGAPIIYYGDEFGMPGAGDPDNRRPMRFGEELNVQESELLEKVRILGRACSCNRSLRRGERIGITAEKDVLVYGRRYGDENPALIVLNRSVKAKRISFALPEKLKSSDNVEYFDIWNNPLEMDGGTFTITLSPLSGAVLVSAACP